MRHRGGHQPPGFPRRETKKHAFIQHRTKRAPWYHLTSRQMPRTHWPVTRATGRSIAWRAESWPRPDSLGPRPNSPSRALRFNHPAPKRPSPHPPKGLHRTALSLNAQNRDTPLFHRILRINLISIAILYGFVKQLLFFCINFSVFRFVIADTPINQVHNLSIDRAAFIFGNVPQL